jgi:glycosyltransferase involved in cell wall biosynthesis
MIRLRYPVAYDRSRGFGVVAIGRNEGDRLKRCLASALCAAAVVYVDSGSTDGSVAWATATGVDVVVLQGYFTAARARNAGFIRLNEIAPSLEFVQFLDGDCELLEDWPQQAISFLERHEKVCAVFGRRRERFPDRSIYNRLCDKEWNTPIGEALAFGGDVMIRAQTLGDAGGYREDLIAGEEPELCVRLRSHGNHIWRLDFDMTMHDANIVRFGQWWRRNVRSGYAFAQGAHLRFRALGLGITARADMGTMASNLVCGRRVDAQTLGSFDIFGLSAPVAAQISACVRIRTHPIAVEVRVFRNACKISGSPRTT